jgi:hypothetical protein
VFQFRCEAAKKSVTGIETIYSRLRQFARAVLLEGRHMSEIHFNALRRWQNVPSPANSASNPKPSKSKDSKEADSVQLSRVPDLSEVEKKVEAEFAQLRSSLQEKVDSPSYPPLEAIDRLARIFGIQNQSQMENPES